MLIVEGICSSYDYFLFHSFESMFGCVLKRATFQYGIDEIYAFKTRTMWGMGDA